MALRRQEGDSFDWFFLSLVELKMGQAKAARAWYDCAVEWYRQRAPLDDELYRFQTEAALALGLPKPEAPALASEIGAISPSLRPGSIHRMVRRKSAEAALKPRAR